MKLSDKEYLLKVADSLDNAGRLDISRHEFEGAKVIQLSHELAKELADRFREMAENME